MVLKTGKSWEFQLKKNPDKEKLRKACMSWEKLGKFIV